MIDEKKLKAVEMKLRAAIESGLEEGWYLVEGDIGTSQWPRCCAVGMLVRDLPNGWSTSLYNTAAKRLGITGGELTAIWSGFDTGRDYVDPLRAIGASLRRDYFETTEI